MMDPTVNPDFKEDEDPPDDPDNPDDNDGTDILYWFVDRKFLD